MLNTIESEIDVSTNGRVVDSDTPSITDLVKGIVIDAKELLSQQIALLQAELKEDLRRSSQAALYMGLGTATFAAGALLLLLGAVFLLNWLAPEVQLWVCFAIIGGPLAVFGCICYFTGQNRLHSLNPLPEKTIHALSENLSWIAKPRK